MIEPSQKDNSTRNILFAVAAVELNQAVLIGVPSLPSILRLLIVCAAVLWGALGSPIRKIEALGEKGAIAILWGGLAVQFGELLVFGLRSHSTSPAPTVNASFIAGIVACAAMTLAVTLLIVVGLAHAGKAWFIAVVCAHFCLGIAYLKSSAPPKIDVYEYQQRGSAALLSGNNPYTASYPNLYGDHTDFYSPGSYAGDRLLFGFPYPPLILFLGLPSFLLTGDVRYSHLTAIALSGLLMGLARKGLLSKLSALLFLFSPSVFWIVHESWTEPFVILLMGAVIVQRSSDLSRFLALGLLMASKQYSILVAPAAWFLTSVQSWRAYAGLLLRSGAVSLAISLPLAMWNFRAFFQSVVVLQFRQPFRADSLSFPAWLVRLGSPQPPVWLAFAAVGVAGFFLFKRLRPSPVSFAASLAVSYLLFISLNKQAFVNYYFLVEACVCWVIAAPQGSTGKRLKLPQITAD